MIKTVIITVVILVVPAYFAALILMGGYHSLVKLRDRCAAARSSSEHAQATSAYEAERKSFPTCLAAFAFRFRAAPPFNPTSAGESAGRGRGVASSE